MCEHEAGSETEAFPPVVSGTPFDRWVERHWFRLLLAAFAVLVVTQVAERKPGDLRFLTLQGYVLYQLESIRFERLLNCAASGNSEALRQVTSRPYLSVVTFATEHPDLVRPEIRIGELNRREGDSLPPPPRAVVEP